MAVGLIVSVLILLAIFLYTTGVLTFLKRVYVSNKAMRQFPTEKHHWFFGHLAVHPGANEEGLWTNVRWATNNPRYYAVYGGPLRPILVLNHPETVKLMLKTAEPKALVGGGGYTLLRPWLGDGLLISSGDKWFRNRRLLTPGFHFEILKPYMDVYNKCVETLMTKFDTLSAQTHESIDVFRPVSLCTLDIILRCAFSTEKDVQGHGDDEPYVKSITSISKLVVHRGLNPQLYLDNIYYRTQNGKEFQQLCDFFHQDALAIMHKRKAELASRSNSQNHQKKYVDFLDILLLARDESGNGLTETDIRDEVETFMFEGHDTTASGISWILYNLAKHPDIQYKARDEIDSILNDRGNDFIEWSDLSQMPYLTMCIKESLRTHPPVHFVSRQTTKPFHVDGKTLPAHTLVNINIFNIHHNPTVWSDPTTYNPDRFLPENMSKMDSHAFLPFSAGPRNCIGQNFAMNEMKTTVARILRRFEFKLDATKEVRMMPGIVLRSESGIYLCFETRQT